MLDRIQGLKVTDVECDALWSYVGMKKKTKTLKGETSDELGDAWTFTAIESNSKLILAWHVGHRTPDDTLTFTERLRTRRLDRFRLALTVLVLPRCGRNESWSSARKLRTVNQNLPLEPNGRNPVQSGRMPWL